MIVFECIHSLLDGFLHFEFCHLGLSILIRIWLLGLDLAPEGLSFFDLLRSGICFLLDYLDFVGIPDLFESFDLILLEDSVVIKHSEVLDIEHLGELHSLHSVLHDSVEEIRLVVGSHQ